MGRVISDNALDLEAAAICFFATELGRAGAVLFDFATAFTFLARAWIFAVFAPTCVPTHVVCILCGHYTDRASDMVFAGLTVGVLIVFSGIKQGCLAPGSVATLVVGSPSQSRAGL